MPRCSQAERPLRPATAAAKCDPAMIVRARLRHENRHRSVDADDKCKTLGASFS